MNCLSCPKADDCTTLCDEMREDLQSVEVAWHEVVGNAYYSNGEEMRVFNQATGTDRPFLSWREKQVVRLVSLGKTAPIISESLKISIRMVNRHIKKLEEKVTMLGTI
jgi:DNA-binding NarL/FixJ family response regulator